MNHIFDREKLLIGEDGLKKLNNAKIAVVGVGGVGGYVCEMLARSGIGEILICDFDNVDETNINRQIIALKNSIGLFKVDVMEERIKQINPNMKITKICDKLDAELIKTLNLDKFDYIVDAIDDVHNKFELIKYAKSNNLRIITALGAGNKLCVPNYIVSDIYDTSYDKLAKILRNKCKQFGIKNLNVVYMQTDKIIKNNSGKVGSISYHPCACGVVIASFVVNEILK